MKGDVTFKQALIGKKVPILVLDQKWHRLFAIHGKTDEIKKIEGELGVLLAKQGKYNSELKDLKKLKSKLMSNIVENMDESKENVDSKLREKTLEQDKKLIDDINVQIDEKEDLLLEIPGEIKELNEQLMILSMDYFNDKIVKNREEAREIDEWITNIRIELKKNIVKKQNREINNKEIYSYLHDIFGPEVLELFEIEYDDPMVNKKES